VTGTPEEVAAVTDILAAQDLDARQVVAADFGSLPAELGPSSGSYALMALAALRTDRRPLLDFANPTQPPTDDAAKRRRILLAALAATLLIGLLGLGWLEIRRLDQQLAQLQAEVSTLESEEPANTMTINRVGMINDFLLMDVEPLSILEQLSQQLPYGDQLRVQSLKVNVGRMAQVGSFPVTMTSRLIDEDLAEDYKPTLHAHPLWTFDPVTKLTSISSKHYRSQAVDVFTVAPDFEVIYDRLANAIWKDQDSGEATSAALPPTSGTDGDPATTATADPAPASQSSAEVTTADETESAVEQVPPAGRTDRSSADSSEQADDDESEAESDQRAAEEREQSRREGEASGDAGTERTDTEQQEEGEGDGD
jgi:hypothetical protein